MELGLGELQFCTTLTGGSLQLFHGLFRYQMAGTWGLLLLLHIPIHPKIEVIFQRMIK